MDHPMLQEPYILENWEKDFEEGLYFVDLKDGSSLGYSYTMEEFSYDNYWNSIPYEEAEKLVKTIGVDL